MVYKSWEDLSLDERVQRWEKVAEVLQNLTPHEKRKHFNMEVWGEKTDCGTVACAAGHCGLDPWFRRRGFKMNFNVSYDTDINGKRIKVFDPHFSEMGPARFFGYAGSERIFHNTDNRSVGAVIKEIKQYVKELKDD